MPHNKPDVRAAPLSRKLAKRRDAAKTEPSITELEHHGRRNPLAMRLSAIADDLASKSGPDGRRMTRDEIDALWGV